MSKPGRRQGCTSATHSSWLFCQQCWAITIITTSRRLSRSTSVKNWAARGDSKQGLFLGTALLGQQRQPNPVMIERDTLWYTNVHRGAIQQSVGLSIMYMYWNSVIIGSMTTFPIWWTCTWKECAINGPFKRNSITTENLRYAHTYSCGHLGHVWS